MKKLLVPLVALGLLLGAEMTLADRDDRNDRRGYDRGHDRDYRGNNGNGWGHGIQQRRWDNRRDVRRYDDRDLSISLSFGNVTRPYYGSSFGTGFGINTWSGFGSSWNRPARTYDNRQPVVIYQNQNTYINRSTPIVSRPSTFGTSLLRDVNGRCYEREFDSRGNETRLELPSAACNF